MRRCAASGVAAFILAWSEYQANSTTGSPSAITISAPGNTQSGRPSAMTAALATIATATQRRRKIARACGSIAAPSSEARASPPCAPLAIVSSAWTMSFAGLRPLVRVLVQAPHDELGERGRRVRAQLVIGARLLAHVRREHARRRPVVERRLSRSAARTPCSRASRCRRDGRPRVAGRLLGRHVRRRADRRPDLGERVRRRLRRARR